MAYLQIASRYRVHAYEDICGNNISIIRSNAARKLAIRDHLVSLEPVRLTLWHDNNWLPDWLIHRANTEPAVGLYEVRSPWWLSGVHFSVCLFSPASPQRIRFCALDVANAHLLASFFTRERHWWIIRGTGFTRRRHRMRFITQLGIRDGVRSQTSTRELLASASWKAPPRDASTRVNYRVRATDSWTSVTRPRDDNISPPSLKTNSGANSVGSHRSNRLLCPICLEKFPDEILRSLFPPLFFTLFNSSKFSLKIFSLPASALPIDVFMYYSSFNFPRRCKISLKKGVSSDIKIYEYIHFNIMKFIYFRKIVSKLFENKLFVREILYRYIISI